MKSIKLHKVTTVQTSATVSPDKAALSVLFDNAVCIHDANQAPNIVSALAFDILLEIQIDRPHNLRCDLRGSFANSDASCWAIVTARAQGRWRSVDSVRERANFTKRLKLTLPRSGIYTLSLLQVTQCDASAPDAMARVDLDSVDFSLVPGPKVGRKKKS